MNTDPVTYNPQSGNYIAADGRVYNVVDMLGGGTPINEQVYDVNQYAPKCGLVLGSDGRMYDLPQMLLALAAKRRNAPVETELKEYTPTAEETRLRLLHESDPAMALDRLGLTVPEGTTFKAWEPFLTRLGSALTGDVARYRQALRDLPKRPDWPNTPPEDWPQAPEGMNEN